MVDAMMLKAPSNSCITLIEGPVQGSLKPLLSDTKCLDIGSLLSSIDPVEPKIGRVESAFLRPISLDGKHPEIVAAAAEEYDPFTVDRP